MVAEAPIPAPARTTPRAAPRVRSPRAVGAVLIARRLSPLVAGPRPARRRDVARDRRAGTTGHLTPGRDAPDHGLLRIRGRQRAVRGAGRQPAAVGRGGL